MTDESRKALQDAIKRNPIDDREALMNVIAALLVRVSELESSYKDLEMLRNATAGALSVVQGERDQLRAKLAAIAEKVWPSPELPEPHRTPAKAYALMNWYKHTAEHNALKVVEAEERNQKLVDALEYIACRSQTLNLLWWQIKAREAIANDAEVSR